MGMECLTAQLTRYSLEKGFKLCLSAKESAALGSTWYYVKACFTPVQCHPCNARKEHCLLDQSWNTTSCRKVCAYNDDMIGPLLLQAAAPSAAAIPAAVQRTPLEALLDVARNMFPDNVAAAAVNMNILGVITFSLFFGLCLSTVGDAAEPMIKLVDVSTHAYTHCVAATGIAHQLLCSLAVVVGIGAVLCCDVLSCAMLCCQP